MYAVVATGGKQYRVAPGEVVQVEKVPGEVGESVEFGQVLLVAPDEGDIVVGRPTVQGAFWTGLRRSSTSVNSS